MARRLPTPAGPEINLGRMGPIQLIPPGFMGLLQLKQTGRLPGTLSDIVTGVIELRDWYLTARRVAVPVLFPGATNPVINGITAASSFSGFVPAAGGVAQVPAGQIWYVEEMYVTGLTAAAGSTMRFACALSGSGQDVVTVGPDYSDGPVTAANRRYAARNDRGFWAFPGDTFGVTVLAVTTGSAESLVLFLRATALPI